MNLTPQQMYSRLFAVEGCCVRAERGGTKGSVSLSLSQAMAAGAAVEQLCLAGTTSSSVARTFPYACSLLVAD